MPNPSHRLRFYRQIYFAMNANSEDLCYAFLPSASYSDSTSLWTKYFLQPPSLCTHYKTTLYSQPLVFWGYEVRYAIDCKAVRFFAWLPSHLNESCSSVVLLQTVNRCQEQPGNSAALVACVRETHGTQPKHGNSYNCHSANCVCACYYKKNIQKLSSLTSTKRQCRCQGPFQWRDISPQLVSYPPLDLSNPPIPTNLLSHIMAVCWKWVHSYRTFIYRHVVFFIFNMSRLIRMLWSRTSSVNALRNFLLKNLISSVSVLLLSVKFSQKYDRMTVIIGICPFNSASLLLFVRVYFIFPNI
jgi:hypothetical protein